MSNRVPPSLDARRTKGGAAAIMRLWWPPFAAVHVARARLRLARTRRWAAAISLPRDCRARRLIEIRVAREKVADQSPNLLRVGLEGEVARIEEMNCRA